MKTNPILRLKPFAWASAAILAAALLLIVVTHLGAQSRAQAAPLLSDVQIRELVNQVVDEDIENGKLARDYMFIEREEERKLGNTGMVKSTKSKTYEVMQLYDSEVRRLIARNDQQLPGEEARKEEERIRKLTDKPANEDASERAKWEARRERRREEDRRFVGEVSEAYNFTFVDVTAMDGRQTYVIDGVPRPGYQPQLKEAKILPKFRFRAWIDKDDREWKKLDIQCIDTVSFGLILALLHKGSRVVIEQTRVNGEVWLPQHVAVNVDARVALLKGFSLDQDVTFRDYRKFRAYTKVVPIGATTGQP